MNKTKHSDCIRSYFGKILKIYRTVKVKNLGERRQLKSHFAKIISANNIENRRDQLAPIKNTSSLYHMVAFNVNIINSARCY